MSNYKTDGHVISGEGGHMGIFSAVNLLNDKCDEIKSLQAQLKAKDEIIREACWWIDNWDIAEKCPNTFLNKPEIKEILKGGGE